MGSELVGNSVANKRHRQRGKASVRAGGAPEEKERKNYAGAIFEDMIA